MQRCAAQPTGSRESGQNKGSQAVSEGVTSSERANSTGLVKSRALAVRTIIAEQPALSRCFVVRDFIWPEKRSVPNSVWSHGTCRTVPPPELFAARVASVQGQ